MAKKTFIVPMDIRFTQHRYVEAENEKEAIEKAERYDFNDVTLAVNEPFAEQKYNPYNARINKLKKKDKQWYNETTNIEDGIDDLNNNM
jgi:hypothetical protein